MPSVSQPLKQSGYVNRKFDDDLDVLLKSFTIVEIEGVLGCGKTWTALAHAQSVTTLGDTKMVLPIIQANPHIALTGVAPHLIDVLGCGKTWTALAHAQSVTTLGDTKMVLPIIQANPHIALTGVAPHLIDDWTNLPELQELMYRESGRPGSYISVSSHIPQTEDIYVRRHAARGVKVRMRTCTIDELGFSRREVAWEDLVAGRFSPGSTTLELERTARLICSGGWPAGIGQEDEIARQTAECSVEEAILQVSTVFKKMVPTASVVLTAIADGAGEDTNHPALTKRIEQLGIKPPSRTTLSTYLGILERLCLIERVQGWDAPIRSKSRVRTKPRYFPVVKPPSRTTLSTYLGILERLCLIERVQGWDAPIRSKSRVRTKPRYFPVDCSVSTSMRQLAANDLLGNAPLFQACLKSMVLHELLCRVDSPASKTPGRVCYYSDADGLEIDFILLFDDGSWGLKSMVLHELLCRVDSPASKTPGRVCYYSDADGLEIDFILLFDDGSWAPINVELGEHQVTSSAKRIARLYNKLASNEGDGLEIDFILLFDDGSWAPINVELGEHQVTSSAKRIARLYNKLASNEGSGIHPPAFSAIILGSAAKRSHEKISDSFVFPITDLY